MSWRLARSLQTWNREVRDRWPGTTIWTVGDADHRSRPSDHNPADHDDDPSTAEVVTAVDVVGRDIARACWDHLLAIRDDRVEYAIFDGQATGADYGWQVRSYTGSNPHRDHLHLSVGRGSDGRPTRPDLFDDPSPWGLSEEDDIMIDKNTPLPSPSNAVTKHQNALLAWRSGILPQYGADGDFGQETEDAVKAYQKAADLPVTGRIDGVTSALLMEYMRDHAAAGGMTQEQADRRYARKRHVHDYAAEGHGHTGTVTVS